MSEEDDGAEKSHEASEQKLIEARKKGDFVKSTDLHTAAGYAGMVLCILVAAPTALNYFGKFGHSMFAHPDEFAEQLLSDGGKSFHADILLVIAVSCSVFFLLPAMGTLLSLIGQRAIVFAPNKLEPKLSKVSLLSNAKQKFGATGLFEFFKSAVKMLIISTTLFWFLSANLALMVGAITAAPGQLVALMGKLLADFLVFVLVIAGLIGAVDYFWQRHSHLKQQMMTRQEMIDEHKKSEGDPHVKGQRRQRGQEIALNQMLGQVPDATVVVVNPTHYAVALKWSPSDPTPPICVAKGVDEIAAQIRRVAAENGVPIHRDPPTARALHATVEVGDPIDREHFAAVAIAVRFADEMRKKAKKGRWS
jgi:flagellar biosynthetic protein FlhB